MTNPKESAEEKPASSKQQPKEEKSPKNAPIIQGRREQNESHMTDQSEKSEGDNNVKSQDGKQEKTGQNKTKTTQTEGDTKTKGSEGNNVKGQSGDDADQKGTPSNLENEENVTETEKGEETGASATAAGYSGRKRGRKGDPNHVGSSSGSNSKAGKKMEPETPSGAPTCYVCKRHFTSWKAVFGHLKAHRSQLPGAFPPPTFPPKTSPEKNKNGDNALKKQLAPTLLNLAFETMQKMSKDTTVSAGLASSSSRGLDIDLNEPRTSVLLDLNQSPPPEKDDDDNNADK